MSSKNVLVSVIKKLAKSGGEVCAAAVGVQPAGSGCCGTSTASVSCGEPRSACCGAVHPSDDLPEGDSASEPRAQSHSR